MNIESKANEESVDNNRITISQSAVKFQGTGLYRNVNKINREGKILQDTCGRLKSLPDMLLGPCMSISALLFLLVLLTYLIGTIWACCYDIYDFDYYDANDQHYHASILIGTNDSPVSDSLDNSRVCDHYSLDCQSVTSEPSPSPTRHPGFSADSSNSIVNSINDNNNRMLSSVQIVDSDDVTLTKLETFDAVMIKIQWFISWGTWVRLRIFMLDVDLLSWKYVLYFIVQNAVSWNFRSLGFIVLETNEHILYSAYYSSAFVGAIITFLLSGLLWSLLVGICLKRQIPNNGNDRDTKMVLRRWGTMSEDGSVDWKSIMANLFVILFFCYLCFAPTIWLAYDNIVKEIDDEFINSSNTADSDSLIQWIDLLFVQIKAYFLPDFEWYYPFTLAGIFQNVLTGVDIITFFLKLINDFNEKRREKKSSAKYSAYRALDG